MNLFDINNTQPSFSNQNQAYFKVICQFYNKKTNKWEPYSGTTTLNQTYPGSYGSQGWLTQLEIPETGEYKIIVEFVDAASNGYFTYNYKYESIPGELNRPIRRIFKGEQENYVYDESITVTLKYFGWEEAYLNK